MKLLCLQLLFNIKWFIFFIEKYCYPIVGCDKHSIVFINIIFGIEYYNIYKFN